VVGAGVTDLTTALDASFSTLDYQVVVVPQQDAATLTAVIAHIADAWGDPGIDRPRVVVLGVDGTIGTAQTAASTLDDYRALIANAEKPASPIVARSLSLPYELAAEVGTLLISQSRPNPNLNKSRIVTPGRGQLLLNSSDEIASGVTVVQPPTGADHGGRVLRPVSTAITDQTGQTSAPDTSWQPIEIALTVIYTWLQMRAALERFSSDPELGVSSEANRQSARQSVLGVLELEAASNYLAFNADEQDVQYETIGGSRRLRVSLRYAVITATDIVAVTHDVVRNLG
jgi:phage tail sheath gpL-like